jgi:long-chain acyl-CoA synthetase
MPPASAPFTLEELPRALARGAGHGVISYRGDRPSKTGYAALLAEVDRLKADLARCGVGAGDRVGLAGTNSCEWIAADLALIGLGCVSVVFPWEMIQQDPLEQLGARYQLDAFLFVQKPAGGPALPAWAACLQDAHLQLRKRGGNEGRAPFPGDVFTLVFSSGTTGKRKCLLMSRKGIESCVAQSAAAWQVEAADNFLLFMPFSTMQQRIMAYLAILHGFDVSVVSPERLFRALRELQPTLFIAPPSFLDAVEKQGGDPRARLGGRMRMLITGSAPSRRATLDYFVDAGVPLYEVYGLTEFGWIAMNLPGARRVGAVGRPAPGVSVEIADDGEIVVASAAPQTFGYRYDGEDEQASVYLPGERIATGDTGRIDEDGYLHLSGRKKNVIVMKSGYKVNPEAIEEKLQGIDALRRVAVLSDGSSMLACVAWIDDPGSSGARAGIEAAIERLNRILPPPERIGRLLLRDAAELTVESGLLTRNFKLNRAAVLQQLAPRPVAGAGVG